MDSIKVCNIIAGVLKCSISGMVAIVICSCNGRNTKVLDIRCPELVEKAEYYNSQVANGDKEGPMGMKMSVEYVDSVYRIIQIVDESLIPIEKVKLFYGNMRPNMVASLSSSSGKEREDYQKMVDYRVTFEHVVKSKSTGDVIIKTTFTPDEISDALSHEMTRLDELKMNVASAKNTLPREMETGYIMKDISCTDKVVNIEIEVDEGLKDFDEATKIRQWAKVDQAVTLADLTTGLTFHRVASNVPIGINYHFIGSNRKNELTISFSSDEVVKFNEVMERLKD
jgi:hypothetical protein